ncbi:MAG: hypothetical protein U0800_21305 [Isosphaeraceae bacterium]
MQVLQSVLDTDACEVEHTFLASRAFFDAEPGDFDDTSDEFFTRYEDLVRRFAQVWGPPAFDDGMANPKFPSWYEAAFLACWPKGDHTAYVALRHDDKELPLLLVYGVKRAKAPTSGASGKRGKQLESEADHLTKAVVGKVVAGVRRPAKDVLVIEFQGGGFIAMKVNRSSLAVELPGEG